MALTKGINSYVTVAEADSYFEDRLDVAAWTEANAVQKAQALVTATSMLDALEWTGVAVSASQTLAFPRIGIYIDPKAGVEINLTNNIPDRIIVATFELAYHLLNNDGLLDDTGLVKDLSIGSIKLSVINSANKFPNQIKRLIKPLQTNSGMNYWWRAN